MKTSSSGMCWRGGIAAACLVLVAGCSGVPDPSTPEESAARADELMRKMSDTLKASPALSFTVTESHERIRRNGQKAPFTLKRDIVIRRPDRLWGHTTGSDGRDVKVTYDGKAVTVVGDGQKIYATFKAASTLDETLDLISERYDLQIVVADFLYSSPYDSFADGQTKGRWVRRVAGAGGECQEVAYSAKAVDFTLSVSTAEPTLPCELHVTYKEEPGQPITGLVFSNWNLKAQLKDNQFVASVPQGYEQIPVIERIPKTELKADAAKAMNAPPKK